MLSGRMSSGFLLTLALLFVLSVMLAACGDKDEEQTEENQETKPRIGLVIDSGTENDRGFNQYSLEGARRAAEAGGIEFTYLTSQSTSDYEAHVESLVQEAVDLVITIGFRMGDATSRAAQRHPEISFAIVDNAYFPGSGCPETVEDCYTEAGGLSNVTSLMFAEDQVSYLAGTLAACMSETGKIATVAGVEIPPVVRFVVGFETGAKNFNPDIETMHRYIPDFDDSATGGVVGQGFINDDADIIFGAGGNTGNGGILAAHDADLMAIGVDVDQYFSYPEIAPSLLTSAAKNMDIAVENAVRDFLNGELQSGIRVATLENGGVGLAPFHDWEDRIPQECKDAVDAARQAVIDDPAITGYVP
ncbi:MAG TPA: BMP family ABC transporter substrate-binding protein [Aggregatilineales bacterium]|nr:BMP family ABC transporter substrate-binding protein [Aggregatilineales bacterium]